MKALFFAISMIVSVGFIACSSEGIPLDYNQFRMNPTSEYFAIFGDIQYTTNTKYISIYKHSLDWILDQSEKGLHFNCILQTGDLTMSNDLDQWKSFQKATSSIAERIPFISMIGDHDYEWEDGIHIDNRGSTHINSYIQFPMTTAKVLEWYEDGHIENVVVENAIFGQRFDFLILEFGPRKEVVEWADAYVKSHPDQSFILMNHEYLEKGGGRRVTNVKCASRLRNTTYTTPEQLWNSLIKCNDNIRFVLCGHVGGLYALTVEENDFGREIPQIQHNIQSEEFRYDNWLMLWEFPAESDSANVFILNTQTNAFFDDKEVLFKFKYKDD